MERRPCSFLAAGVARGRWLRAPPGEGEGRLATRRPARSNTVMDRALLHNMNPNPLAEGPPLRACFGSRQGPARRIPQSGARANAGLGAWPRFGPWIPSGLTEN